MAGRGPAPKPAGKRARRNADPVATRVLDLKPAKLPTEPPTDLLPDGDEWHPATLRWWGRWVASPLFVSLPDTDLSELEAIAVLHHEFMRKRTFTLASELRLRMAKFGATPEDRARLRISVADADEKDDKRAGKRTTSRDRYQGLSAVKSG